MKLAIDGEVFNWWSRGGIRRIYAEVLPRLDVLAPDISVTVAVRTRRGLQGERLSQMGRVIPHVPEHWRPWRLWRRTATVLDPLLSSLYWKRTKTDVFHPTYYGTRPVIAPSFCFVYDAIMEIFPESFEPALVKDVHERKVAALMAAKRILCISRQTKDDIVRLFDVPEERCIVVYLSGGIKTKEDMMAAKPDETMPFVLYVGDYWTRYKNFEFLLECFGGKLCNEFGDWQLFVVSSRGPSQEERQRYESKLPGNRLRFLVKVEDNELGDVYRRCGVFVCPSLYEGFGIPVVEALSAGAPVVCARAGALPEIGGGVVEYFDPRSPSELAAALSRAITEGRSPVAVARRQIQADWFSWDRTTKGFVKAVRETVSEG